MRPRARTLHDRGAGRHRIPWIPNAAPESLDDVKLAIFRQHTQLAQLLDELEASADAVLDEGRRRRSPPPSRSSVLHVRFASHLEYEESHLSEQGRSLGDHGEQRARMKGLVHDRDVFGDPQDLAREARAFVHVLRKDMAEEDAKLRALG